MLKYKKQKHITGIRGMACDGDGLTAATVALNKLSSGCWEQIVEAWKARLKTRRKDDGGLNYGK